MAKRSLLQVFCIILFLFLPLMGNEKKSVEILADVIEQNKTTIVADGNIVVYSPTFYLTGDKLIYDKNTTVIELFGDVTVAKHGETVIKTEYAYIDTTRDIDKFAPIFFLDKKTNVWINGRIIEKEQDLQTIQNATLSSCDCVDPSWSIGFEKGDYNTTDQWINTYNNTLYIHNIPAWYFLIPVVPYAPLPSLAMGLLITKPPYLGFSTNKERRSGLLQPRLGYSNDEGFFYAQPFYYAPRKDLDFEYIPQIRTQRGEGHQFNFRYADSYYSKFGLEVGGFNEKESYHKENNLLYQQHYGWNLEYDRKKLFSTQNHQDGLYIYAQQTSDVEYLNTQYESDLKGITVDKIEESMVKYFYDTPTFHGYIEGSKYNDISNNKNDSLMQISPFVGLHLYSTPLYFDTLRTLLDLQYKKLDRKTGVAADLSEALLPIEWSWYLIDDYLLFSYQKLINLKNIHYTNNQNMVYEDGALVQSKDIISLETDLLRAYETKVHTFSFGVGYENPKIVSKQGDLYGITSTDQDLALFPNETQLENALIRFNQSLYNKENLGTIFNHKIEQKIVFDENGTGVLDNLENEITLYFPYMSLSNRVLYNHDEKIFVNSTTAIEFRKDNYFATLDYGYSLDKNTTTQRYKNGEEVKTITGDIGTKVLKYYTLGYKEQYDLVHDISKFKEYRFGIDKKCWGLALSFQDSLIATATQSERAKRQSIVYATISLKPVFELSQKYIQDTREE